MLATIEQPVEDDELPSRRSKRGSLRLRAEKRVTTLMSSAVKLARRDIVAQAEETCDDLNSVEFDIALLETLGEWNWREAIEEADNE